MSNPEQTSAPPELVVSDIMINELAKEPDILALLQEHSARDFRINQNYGPAARTLRLTDEGLAIGEQSAKLGPGRSSPKLIIQSVLNYPDNWIHYGQFKNVYPGHNIGADVRNYNLRLDGIFEKNRIGNRSQVRLAQDLRVIDQRTTPDEPVIKKTRLQSRIEMSLGIRASAGTVAEPLVRQLDVVRIGTSLGQPPILDKPAIVDHVYPRRYVQILNRTTVNEDTKDYAEFMSTRSGRQQAVDIHELTIFDDTHSDWDGQANEIGPLPTRIINALIANYMYAKVGVESLVNDATSSTMDATQKFLRQLVVRDQIMYEATGSTITSISLKPTIFNDARPSST